MNWRIVGLAVFLLIAVVFVSAGSFDYFVHHKEADWIANDVSFELSSDKLNDYRNRAKAGDNKAARAVADHYYVTGDREECRKWQILAASRGDCLAMLSLIGDEELTGQQRSYWKAQAKKIDCDGSYYFRNK